MKTADERAIEIQVAWGLPVRASRTRQMEKAIHDYASDRLAARESEALRLLAEMVREDPWERLGTGDTAYMGCHFCGGALEEEEEMHNPGCSYVAARSLLGMEAW